MNLYHNMGKKELERQYSPSIYVDDMMNYIRQYDEQSRLARTFLTGQYEADISYGPEPGARMDIFRPKGEGPFPVHIFIHGGYWQELSKEESCFAAPNFINHDIIFIALGYSLAPAASLSEIVNQVRHAILWILKNIEGYGGMGENITLSGSSAGAHLVAECLNINWPEYGYNDCPVKGACLISGIYDLRPLVHTPINDPLDLTAADAIALSPLFHIAEHACPVIFSIGEDESSEFKRQTRTYMSAWQNAGHKASYVAMPGFNHFDIILELTNSSSPLFRAVLAQIMA